MLYTLLLVFNTAEKNLTECELIPFLVWTNSNVGSDNTKSHVGLKKSKVITKTSASVTSKHNTDHSKTQNTMDNIIF